MRAPMPPGRYRLALDLVLEWRYWLEEVGNTPLTRDVDVAPRIERALAVVGRDPPRQDEPLVAAGEAAAIAHLAPGVEPARDWSARVLDAHQEGYGVVGPPWRAAAGRSAPTRPAPDGTRRSRHPLLCPSVVRGLEPAVEEFGGLPALRPPEGEPWTHEARAVLRKEPVPAAGGGHRRGS